MDKQQSKYTIENFEKLEPKDREWIIEWANGDIELNSDVESEPSIQILLGLIKENYDGDLSSSDAIEKRESTKIGVGQIVNLSTGSIIKNGHIRKHVGKTQKIHINTNQAQFFKATEKVNNQLVITYSDQRTSGFGKASWCLCFPVGDDPAGIIIPVTEIIRFYFATSTLLSKAIYTGEITHNLNKFVNLDYCGMNGSECIVHRRKNVSDNDCWILGRILNNYDTQAAAQAVHDSLMLQKYNKEKILHPKTGFPFAGETNLTVKCKTIGHNLKRILVLRILNCTNHFPYDSLVVIADNDNNEADPKTDKPDADKKEINFNKNTKKDTTNTTITSGNEPDKAIQANTFRSFDNRFEFLKDKKIKKIKKEYCNYKSGQLKTLLHENLLKNYGTGDGNFTKNETQKANITVDRQVVPANYESFKKIIEHLNDKDIFQNINVDLVNIDNDKLAGTVYATLLSSKIGRQWSYLVYKNKPHKIRIRRQFMVAHVTLEIKGKSNKNFLIVDIERRTAIKKGKEEQTENYRLEVFNYYGDKDTSIQLIVDKLSEKTGRLNDIQLVSATLPRIVRLHNGLTHGFKDEKKFATAIYELINLTL